MGRHYPGLNLHRFLMEVSDLLNKKKKSSLIDLEHAVFSVSPVVTSELEGCFLKGIPFPYLLQKAEFYYHDFYVNQHVLIPRPETEFLVDMVVQEFRSKSVRVLDVGTGSGVILLSLLKHGVGKSGIGVDISPDALEVAKINRHRLGLNNKVELLKSDRLSAVTGTFDLIVSNPPYIKASSHKAGVHKSVDAYEPHQALYLPDDYYAFWFEDFFQEIRGHLKGAFFMEGHELEVEEQAKMLGRLGFKKIQVLKDMSGENRFIKAFFS